jgi:regulator of protease activity HflC (stomatin/prohibitin superfamily)
MSVLVIVSWSWILFLWTIVLGLWSWGGWRKIEIGWRGQLLFLGQRIDAEIEEGWRWVPLPFAIKPADCRQQIMPLDALEVTTSDNVRVKVGATVTYRVDDLNTYFGVEVSGLKKGIDDARDAAIRSRVRTLSLEQVLSSHDELGNELLTALEAEAVEWGIKIIRVIIPEISPSDTEVSKDLELRERENLQRNGQRVELSHFDEMVNLLEKGGNLEGITFKGGASREEAVQQVRLALGQSTMAVDAKTITLDSATATLIATFLGRK